MRKSKKSLSKSTIGKVLCNEIEGFIGLILKKTEDSKIILYMYMKKYVEIGYDLLFGLPLSPMHQKARQRLRSVLRTEDPTQRT